jgi:hypothetical protein
MALDVLDFTDLDRSVPLRDWFTEPVQYRAKLQTFSKCPPELTVQKISFERQVKAYQNAYDNGHSSCFPRRAGKRTSSETPDPESVERSQRRSKIKVRKLVTELAPNHFVTFTTRELGPEYFTPEDWRQMWARFTRLLHTAGYDFDYLAVLERHPSNPDHLHLHVAWRGKVNYAHLRRFWHIAICAHKGVRVTQALKGGDAPGNIKDKPIKAAPGTNKRVFKIAKYIAKYITKDLIAEFNKKRYWISKGLTIEAARVFWLRSDQPLDALRESCEILGYWHSEKGALVEQMFMPSDRIVWARLDPEPPPF